MNSAKNLFKVNYGNVYKILLTYMLCSNMIVAMKWKLGVLLGFLASIVLPAFSTQLASADGAVIIAPAVIISEVKLGGDSFSQGVDQPKDPQEFLTLYNQSAAAVDLTGWTLEYAKPTFDKSFCADGNWLSHSVNSSASQTSLSGTLQPGQVSTPIVRSLTDNAAGSVHLINASDKNNLIIEDLVGWGDTAPCNESAAASTPSNGKSIKRYLDCNNLPIDTNNNTRDFTTSQPPSPGVLGNPYLTICTDNSANDPTQTQQSTCEGAVIDEFLPNPAGTDTGNEFIELYNPTSSIISLQGCSLQTTASNKVYNFGNVSLQPGEYHAFYNSETGLTLANAAGGTVWLLSPNTELQAINYQAGLDDNVAWGLIAGAWQATYQPTPNAANILLATKPCPVGEARNIDTGFCRGSASLTTSSLAVCKSGQERSTDTNRCRSSASSTASSLTPCKPGQERNLATNRCKAIANTAAANLKPCATGQERNPATNRCRKATTGVAGKISSVKDTATSSIANSPHWLLAGFAALGATGYGIYEWRQEVLQFLSKIKAAIF
jgi:hypothetical protein